MVVDNSHSYTMFLIACFSFSFCPMACLKHYSTDSCVRDKEAALIATFAIDSGVLSDLQITRRCCSIKVIFKES